MAGLMLALLLGLAHLPAAEPAAVAPDAELLRLATETDRLREEHRQATAAWREEAARLRVVEQGLADELARLDRQLARLADRRAELEPALAGLRDEAERLAGLEERAAALAGQLRTGLAQLHDDSVLAIHQIGEQEDTGTARPDADLVAQLAAAFEALARAERQSRDLVRRRLSGRRPDGRRRAAEVIALGGAAAWWLGADGDGGPVRVVDGTLYFDTAADSAARVALQQAFAVHSGQAASEPVALPVPEAAP